MITRNSRRALTCLLFATTALATPALAQQTTDPLYRHWDENGVDVVQGDNRLNFEEGSIGSGKAKLALMRLNTSFNPSQWDQRILQQSVVNGVTVTAANKADGSYFKFNGSTSAAADGATLLQTTDPATGNYAYQITDGDGVKYLYSDPVGTDAGPDGFCSNLTGPPCQLPLKSITYPDGTVLTFAVRTWQVSTGVYQWRLTSVSNNFGYSVAFTYQTNTGSGGNPPDSWFTRTSAKFTQNGVQQGIVSYSYPVSGTVDITDFAGKVWEVTNTSIKKPGDTSPSFTVTGSPVTSVTNAGVTTIYNRVVNGNIVTLTKTDALGKVSVITSDLNLSQITSTKDPLNRTTSYAYDTSARLTSITKPEGDGTDYVLDARGNATQIKQRPKTGSSSPSLITNATYPTSCTNPVTCNKPTEVTDPAGNPTDYTYDPTHGGVLTVTRAAPTTGAVRPQTRYTYTLTTVGPSTSPGQVYLLTGISECQTTASCAGTADEVKTSLAYDAFGDVTTLSKGDGTGALTATNGMTYDGLGNLLTVDGPLAGTADTTRYRYDAARRLIGVTSPDPDGTGPLVPRAIRYTYDGAGRLTKVERGNVNSQSDADWALFSTAETIDLALDANGRVTNQKLSGSSGATALTQLSYDGDGRLQCSAVRMNTAAFTSLPADACTLGTQGSFGADRITKKVFDDAGEVTQVQEGVGTSDAANERTLTYSNDGDVQTLKDAMNNLTTYTYDEYDRLKLTQYPSPTQGAGTSNANDYEQLGYDTRGNITSRRLRDGNSIAFTYDNLNRVTLKTLPNSEPSVSYAYDNLDRLTSASQTGNALSFTYDALSRKLTEVGPQGTVTSAYDLAGRRTQVTYPGTGLYVNYDYLTTPDVSAVRENGATSGIGVLASYTYDNLGRRTKISFGNGTSTMIAYDPVSRLSSLTQDLAGTANDLTTNGIAYNPANQITSLARSNDAYAYTIASATTPSTANGLNQLATINSQAVGYDTKGNLTSDPTTGKTYGYSSENLLTSAWGGVTLSYDPLLRLYQVAGASTTRFAYDGLNAIAEYNGSNALQHRYVFGPGMDEPIVQYDGSGNRAWLHADERGSIVALSDSSGNKSAINNYDEYGVPGASNSGRFQYTGQMWIPEVGLYYYKARFYAPHLGRFMQTDPAGYRDSLNRYAYVGAEPLSKVDPSGLDAVSGQVCGYTTGSRVRRCGAAWDLAEADVGAVPTDLSAEEAQRAQDAGGNGQTSQASFGGTVVGDLFDSLKQLIAAVIDPSAITSTPRPVNVSDLGTTQGGVVSISGMIWQDTDESALNIWIYNIEATNPPGGPEQGVVYQGLDTAISTAQNLGLDQVVIMGTIANPVLMRFLNSIPARTGYPMTQYTIGNLDYFAIYVGGH